MGTVQSTHTTSKITTSFSKENEAGTRSVSGRKQSDKDIVLVEPDNLISTNEEVSREENDSVVTSEDEFDSDSSDDDEEEEDEEWNERLCILEDASKLAKVADFFHYPEKPVISDGSSSARCYFSRPSAPEQTSPEEEEEATSIRDDAAALKQFAVDYMHPEKPVKAVSEAFGRNYFNRASAEATISREEADERAHILKDARLLKKVAIIYLCPQLPVVSSDPYATGRNFFSRPSAGEYDESNEDRNLILADAKALKQLAVDYMHPEKQVMTLDPCATARSYFTRASAPDEEDQDIVDERESILEDMKQLKKLAVDYLYPENPVMGDPLAFCRNYFDRPSAEEHDSNAEELNLILEDAKQLKHFAMAYMHPEKPVVTNNAFACGRNFFSRPSAEEYDSDAEEREQILEDMKTLKKLAVDYLHPEKPVVTSDPYACGRNYFLRPSAEEYEEVDDMDEREDILEDAMLLKKLAQVYLQPERSIEADPLASCRNYFNRASAESQEDPSEAEERARVLVEAKALKQFAVDYMHPEKPVVTSYPCVTGRNYFTRFSAEQYDDDAEEREMILADMKQLKQLAVDYLHPELPVKSVAGARNYFDRPSASGHTEQIHSQGHAVDHSQGYYGYHDHVLGLVHHEHGEDHSHQSEHFDMDEDALQLFRDNLHSNEMFKGQHPKEAASGEDEEGGNLSRSPSSVMLFDLAAM